MIKKPKEELKEKLQKMNLSELKLYQKDLDKKIKKRVLIKDKNYPLYPLRFLRKLVLSEIKIRKKDKKEH
jgi:hypothetical protein